MSVNARGKRVYRAGYDSYVSLRGQRAQHSLDAGRRYFQPFEGRFDVLHVSFKDGNPGFHVRIMGTAPPSRNAAAVTSDLALRLQGR